MGMVSFPQRIAQLKARPEGHYWVRWKASKAWDVMYWRDCCFWDNSDCAYDQDNFTVGYQIFPPDAM